MFLPMVRNQIFDPMFRNADGYYALNEKEQLHQLAPPINPPYWVYF